MNCSICGAPLPPDGICRNPHLGIPGQPEGEGKPSNVQTVWDAQTVVGPLTEPKTGKKLSAAAWFAPVGLMGSWLLYLIQHLLVNFAFPDLLAEYPILMDLGNLLRSGLIVALCFLLYTLALKERNKAFRTAHISLSFVPIVILDLGNSIKSIFRVLLDYYAEYGEELNKDSFLTKLFAQSEEPWKTVMLLDEILFFVLALGIALVSFFVARAFLRKMEYAEQNGLQPLPFGIGKPRQMKQSFWFAPVSCIVAVFTAAIIFFFLADILTEKNTGKAVVSVEEELRFNLIFNELSSGLNFLIAFLTIVFAVIFYHTATGKWDKNRRNAHKDLLFLPAFMLLIINTAMYILPNIVRSILPADSSEQGISSILPYAIAAFFIAILGISLLPFITMHFLKKCELYDESFTIPAPVTPVQQNRTHPPFYGIPSPYAQPTPYAQPMPYAEPVPYAQQPFPAPPQGYETLPVQSYDAPHAEVWAPAPDAQTGNAPSADTDASANGGEA